MESTCVILLPDALQPECKALIKIYAGKLIQIVINSGNDTDAACDTLRLCKNGTEGKLFSFLQYCCFVMLQKV